MKHMIIFIYLTFILFIHIDQNQSIPIDLSSSDDIQLYSSLWDNTINDIEHEKSIDHYYKRFIDQLLLPERQRRFGNTKYGRSLQDE